MTWIALADHTERRFSLKGIGGDRRETAICSDDPEQLLARGSLMLEARASVDGRPQVLLAYNHAYPWQRSLMVQAIPGGGIALVQVRGDNIAHAAIQHIIPGRTDTLRITFSWDAPKNWAQLTVERPEEDQITTVPVNDPRPMSMGDLRNMMMGRGDHVFADDVIFAALSDDIEPVGPLPTLAPDTPVATPWGFQPLADLRRGDTVLTRDGTVVPILQKVQRCMPARGSFAPVRLRAPYFGLQQDIVVGREQRLVIDGSEVEYLFSEEAVLTPARHLVNGFAALDEPSGPTMTYAQLVLPGHEALILAGTAAESLYIGRLRRKPVEIATSVLRDFDRNGLPEHGRAAYKVLKWFEAIHLARQRAA